MLSLSSTIAWGRGLREMSHYGWSAQILGHRDTRAGQCRTMCTANGTSCPRNVASADTKWFGKAQPETCGQDDGCVLGADPLLCGYHWGMRLFVNHFPASQSRPAPAEVTRVGLPCKTVCSPLPSMPSWSETLARLTVVLKVHLAMSGELLGFPQLGRGSATDLWWT